MKLHPSRFAAMLLVITTFYSCKKVLDKTPVYDLTSANVYNDTANYKKVLARLYSGLALTGQRGPDGRPDISGTNEGASSYLRQYWLLQELTTDEAVISWNDPGLPELHAMNWTSSNEFVTAMYYRIFYQISVCNEFIRETSEERMVARNISENSRQLFRQYRTEARFLRALSYWHALDLYRNVPLVTEDDPVGTFFPEQASGDQIFAYLITELEEIASLLPKHQMNEYGRASRECAWFLLARLYLNAESYIGISHNAEVEKYCQLILDEDYRLDSNYQNLFLADNHLSPEIIFPVCFDGNSTRTWGGTTFLVHAAVGGTMDPGSFGINGGWAGLRTTRALVELFEGFGSDQDGRRNLYSDGQDIDIKNIGNFTDGYAVTKFRNVTSSNLPGSDPSGNFVDIDFPLFRLGEVYLMYAEAVIRNNGDKVFAANLINQLRSRAYGGAGGNISAATLTLDFLLAERGRELHWESCRRTDLIRFKKFTGANYLWPWKGGVITGREVEEFRTLFPLPASDLIANPNLVQNTGY